jgi:hypothetical protein
MVQNIHGLVMLIKKYFGQIATLVDAVEKRAIFLFGLA